MRILFFGTPEVAAEHLGALLEESRYQIVGVVTRPDAPKGRGQKLHPSDVKALAASRGIGSIFTPSDLRDPALLRIWADLKPDLGVVVAYGKILGPALLALPRFGFINVHFSLLPKLRGPSPVEYAILEGLSVTGVSTFWLDAGMDTGPILAQRSLDTQPNETAPKLLARLSKLGEALLQESLELMDLGRAPKIPQDSAQASYSKIIKKQDGQIIWAEPAALTERKVRAYAIWPKSWTMVDGNRVQIIKAVAVPSDDSTAKAGQVTKIEPQKGFFVKCGEGELLIEQVRPEGGRDIAATVWLASRQKGLLKLGT